MLVKGATGSKPTQVNIGLTSVLLVWNQLNIDQMCPTTRDQLEEQPNIPVEENQMHHKTSLISWNDVTFK